MKRSRTPLLVGFVTVAALLAAIFVFFLGQGGFWAYAERLGTHAGFTADEVALDVSLVNG